MSTNLRQFKPGDRVRCIKWSFAPDGEPNFKLGQKGELYTVRAIVANGKFISLEELKVRAGYLWVSTERFELVEPVKPQVSPRYYVNANGLYAHLCHTYQEALNLAQSLCSDGRSVAIFKEIQSITKNPDTYTTTTIIDPEVE